VTAEDINADIPESLKKLSITGRSVIGEGACYVTPLTEITVSDDITTINDYAFYGCENLRVLRLGSALSAVGHAIVSERSENLIVYCAVPRSHINQWSPSWNLAEKPVIYGVKPRIQILKPDGSGASVDLSLGDSSKTTKLTNIKKGDIVYIVAYRPNWDTDQQAVFTISPPAIKASRLLVGNKFQVGVDGTLKARGGELGGFVLGPKKLSAEVEDG
jgi:hypothetical protein